MYRSFYGFTQKPFQDSTRLDFLWLGETHRHILAQLKEAILNKPGLLLLTGDIGTGKTILSNELLRSLDDEVIVARIPDPGLETTEFLDCIADAFKINRQHATEDPFRAQFGRLIDSAAETGKKLLVIIDECQRIRPELLDEIASLADMDSQQDKVLNILLIGQNDLNDMLLHHQDGTLLRRIEISAVIPPLAPDETAAFISHRLTIAGGKETLFTPDALHEIYTFSEGIPRKINIICDHALLSGFIKETRILNDEIVRECGKYFNPPDFTKQPDSPLPAPDSAPEQPVAHDNIEIIAKDPADEIKKTGVFPVWTTISAVVLIAIGIIFLTYIFYPGEYARLISRATNGDLPNSGSFDKTKPSPVRLSSGEIAKKNAANSPDARSLKNAISQDKVELNETSSTKQESQKQKELSEPGTTAVPVDKPQPAENFAAEREINRSSDETTSSAPVEEKQKVADGEDPNNDYQVFSRLKEQMIQKIKKDQSLQSSEEGVKSRSQN